ncbi:MAG: hypothetical protein AAGB25_01285, partial [Pseudomonadota bacterium]
LNGERLCSTETYDWDAATLFIGEGAGDDVERVAPAVTSQKKRAHRRPRMTTAINITPNGTLAPIDEVLKSKIDALNKGECVTIRVVGSPK